VPSASLTDLSIKNLPIPERGQVTYDDAASPLKVRVSHGGAKTFVVFLGSGRRYTIGRYGEVSLADARTAARKLRAEKTLGKILPSTVPLAQARSEYLADIEVRPNTRMYYERYLANLSGRLSDVTPHDIHRILDQFHRSTKAQALATYRAFFNWCSRRHYLNTSPCARMEQPKPRSRTRVLTDDELRHIWAATARPTNYNRIVRLLMLCGQRPRETAAFQSSWIRDREITIPPEVAKNGREHTFPISSFAQALLPSSRRKGQALLFPARGTTEEPFKGWSKCKRALDKKLTGKVAYWQLRDLRRTYRTIQARLKTPPHIAERLINHVSATPEIQRIYDRYEYMDEMRAAVEKYEAFFQALLSSEAMRNAA
jgi:integrase